jgi:hypothetical protein
VFDSGSPAVTATFAGRQFGKQISKSVQIDGDGLNIENIVVNGAHNFSAASWQFLSWGGSDSIHLNGTARADIIKGPSVFSGAVFHGGPGADILRGGSGEDHFDYIRGIFAPARKFPAEPQPTSSSSSRQPIPLPITSPK